MPTEYNGQETMKKILYYFLLIFMVLLCQQSLFGQKKHKDKQTLREKLDLAEKQQQENNLAGALEIYKFVRSKGGVDSVEALIANDSIAWMSYSDNDIEEMYRCIAFFSDYLEKNPDDNVIAQEYQTLKTYYGYLKDALTITSDLCGIWVSDYSEDNDKSPYFIIEIKKTHDGYRGQILPECHLAGKYPMGYYTKYNYNARNELAVSTLEVNTENDSIFANFAEVNFIKGCPECAKIGGKIGFKMIETANELFTDITSDISFFQESFGFRAGVYGATLGMIGAGLIVGGLSYILATAKTRAYSVAVQLQYVTRGEMECVITETVLETTLDNSSKELKNKIFKMRLLKNYPDYDVRFIGYNNQLIGSHTFNIQEAKQLPEYKTKRKNIVAHNKESYKNLFNLFKESHINSPVEVRTHVDTISSVFEMANQGVVQECILPTDYGYYIGKTLNGSPVEETAVHIFNKQSANIFGVLSGQCKNGKCTYTSKYIGAVKNGKRVGEGTNYEYAEDSLSRTLIRETHGTWENDELTGYGEQYDYIHHTCYKGVFGKGGEGVYTDSVKKVHYKGGFEDGKLSGYIVETSFSGTPLFSGKYEKGYRHGEGVEFSPEGNRYEGKWKYGRKNGKGFLYVNNYQYGYIKGSVYCQKWEKDKLIKQKIYEK